MKRLMALCALTIATSAILPTAFGGVVTNDYSWVRGTHYRINGDAEKTARELGYGRRVGLNAVRFWTPGIGTWKKNPAKTVAGIKAFVRLAWENGYYSMPILFNGNGLNPKMLDGKSRPECEAFAKSIVNALKDEPGLLMWDVMNEPTYNGWIGGATDPNEKQRRKDKTFEFIRRACALVKELDPGSHVTLGCTGHDEAERTADCVDVLSFHDYSSTRGEIEANYARMEELGRKTGKCVMQSETGCTAYGNGYDMALEACEQHKFGWFFFNLIIGGYTETFHGVFYDDGTVRDPAAVAAMMGCYRKRDLDGIIPAMPFKPGKEYRLRAVVAVLRRAIRADIRDMNARKRLFVEMERAANYLESCDMVPMAMPPTARIEAWRKMDEPPIAEVRSFAELLARELEKHLPKSARPCRDVVFKPLEAGTMLNDDPVRRLDGKPFAKDPTAIRHDGRYLMCYSASGMDESTNGCAKNQIEVTDL